MGMFDQTFKDDVQRELERRLKFESADGMQTVLIPHVRVTSLVKGDLYGKRIDGFTLGIPDVNQINTLESYFNVAGEEGTVVGLTYPSNGGPVPVKIGTGTKKLPPPGITNVSISTSDKGGFIFKAVVSLKFYGKEQYDFIYQTFLRPGNPIAIEYGHTRPQEGLKDLNFFKNLEDKLGAFTDNFRTNKALATTENAGAVIGLVSNFKVSLNEQNEYEAEIELINSLEFLYSLSPDDTFLAPTGSSSIRQAFGVSEKGDWSPEHDQIFRTVLNDSIHGFHAVQDRPLVTGVARDREGNVIGDAQTSGFGRSPTTFAASASPEHAARFGRSGEYSTSIILPSEWTSQSWFRWPWQDEGETSVNIDVRRQPVQSAAYSTKQSDIVYISLYYFLTRLINQILDYGYVDQKGTLNSIGIRRIILQNSSWGYHDQLRSTDIEKVIINNRNLYAAASYPIEWATTTDTGVHTRRSNYYYGLRRDAYMQKYNEAVTESAFGIVDQWATKEIYGRGSSIRGIFINYSIVRNAFQSADSVGEAIKKVLSGVNSSTAGVLNLNMKFIPVEGQEDSAEYKLAIYDEIASVSSPRHENLYTFFKNKNNDNSGGGISEAISYDFDFSLPNTVAAGVMASTYGRGSTLSGGDAKNNTFINYGYIINPDTGRPAIETMIELGGAPPTPPPPTENTAPVSRVDVETDTRLNNVNERGKWTYQINLGVIGTTNQSMTDMLDALPDPKTRQDVIEAVNQSGPRGSENFEKARTMRHLTDDASKEAFYSLAALVEEGIRSEAVAAVQTAKDRGVRTDREGRYTLGGAAPEERSGLIGAMEDIEEERIFREILGYQELMPAEMKGAVIGSGLFNIFPSSATITIKLQGLDGFRFGDLFSVKNILPDPYDTTNIFMLTGYKHNIDSSGWTTDIDGTLIASNPAGKS